MTNQTTKQENWEKKFDEQFPNLGTDERDFEGTIEKNEVKSFIRSQRQQIIKEFIEGKRCLTCGKIKEGKLTGMCDKCLEG